MAVQKKQKKQSVTPPSQGPLSSRTAGSPRVGNRPQRTGQNGSNVESKSQTKKPACPVDRSAQSCNAVVPRIPAGNGQNVDERLKAARERRDEQQKLRASRELSRLEREQRAKRYYEQQLRDRKKKLQEQRLKEERRRAAVEEKRLQRLKEEKERYETAVRRTLEKSQKAQQQLGRGSRGRKPSKYTLRRSPLTTWEKNLVSRLLTPTCSYLARSRSAACRSGEEVSYHSMNTTTASHKPLQRPGSARGPSASPGRTGSRQRSVCPAQIKPARRVDADKKKSDGDSNMGSPAGNGGARATSGHLSRAASPSPERPLRSIGRHPTPLQVELPSVPEEDGAISASVRSAGNVRPAGKPDKVQLRKLKKENPPETPSTNPPAGQREAQTPTAADGPPRAPEVAPRPSAGTSDPEEASRLLAEKRREARLQREKEEQERLQREEAERRSREELERRRAEERARQEAEARRLVQEKRRREEEEQKRAEEERAQAKREAALLQKQREEESARERQRAEQVQQEREGAAQKEEAERQARKKRLEEIMRRTRRTDSPDKKSAPTRTFPKENTEPALNGRIEDTEKLPVGAKATQLGLNNEEDVVPVVAFKERRSLRALSGLEEIQTHQRAEVI
ncbi:ensconsin-like isoform X2 [Cololabis saira]|uniref:ensconsin-like isoform X2 n=1 Tax=Cololabis saira TaxID=129043 RepID=UPI002AD29058|nr:ensconsin-like isoform X2 [Cololabis saira]